MDAYPCAQELKAGLQNSINLLQKNISEAHVIWDSVRTEISLCQNGDSNYQVCIKAHLVIVCLFVLVWKHAHEGMFILTYIRIHLEVHKFIYALYKYVCTCMWALYICIHKQCLIFKNQIR